MDSGIAACTIVSLNYIPYARVLSESFTRNHPDSRFIVLVVDRRNGPVDLSRERFETVYIEDLGVPDFPSISFKYDILELNTGIKPSFLKYLLRSGAEKLVYLDPDVCVYRPLGEIYSLLDRSEIVLTPHITRPLPADRRAEEQKYLLGGVYNLGFIGVRRGDVASRFLDWWERHCLDLGYLELQSGLFVDQKWVELAPCLFDSVHILKHPGCNMAYWNLRERTLSGGAGEWFVNGEAPLLFFHFSGIDPLASDQLSKNQDEFDLSIRQDLREIFSAYRAALAEAGISSFRDIPYSFGCYSNGEPIAPLARRVYSVVRHLFPGDDPFDATGPFRAWAKRNRLLLKAGEAPSGIPLSRTQRISRERILNRFLSISLRALGPERYLRLMKYLSYISNPRNQVDLFGR